MNKKIKIIILYFGKFSNTVMPFLLSCKYNVDIEWLLFTDNCLVEVPQNIKVIKCSLSDIKNKIEKVIGFKVALEAPYKLCDFRPAFGLIFKDYLKNCDFWGWGDIDLLYGDLSNFITDEMLNKYDKIYPCGHLSLLCNCDEINKAFMVDVPGTLNYKEVFTNSKSFIFDEYQGINEKLIYLGKKIYGYIEFADMDIVYKRFRTTNKNTLRMVFPNYLYLDEVPKNYKNQLFVWENGKSYRYYIKNNKIKKNELVYIHYRHKIYCKKVFEGSNIILITNKGIIEKNDSINKNDILLNNPYPGLMVEILEYLTFFKERVILLLGANKKFRNFVRILKRKKKI